MSNTQRRWRVVTTVAIAALTFRSPTVAESQQPSANYTLEDVLVSLRRGADTLHLAQTDTARNRALDEVSAKLRAAGATSLTIDALADIVTKRRPSLGDVARWNPQPRAPWAGPWFDSALVMLRRIANTPTVGISAQLVARLGPGADPFIAPMDDFGTKIIVRAQAANAEKLRRYEIKYGPESARLNIAEVVINYLAERPSWSPFAPDENGPSPMEIVATYSTSELTGSKSSTDKFLPHLVAGAHTGLRFYRFAAKPASGNKLQRLLSPQHIGAGVFFLGATDHALVSPFEKGNRKGGFLDWGLARLALTGGHDWRAVIGVGKQILPYLF